MQKSKFKMQNNSTSFIGYRPTWAEVNLSNLDYNFKMMKKLLIPDFALGFEENGLNLCQDKACEQKNRRRIQCNTPRTLLRAKRIHGKELETFYRNPNANSELIRDTKVMVTVKADAYGHGLVPVAKKLVSSGADYLAVASIDEAIKLREASLNPPILVLGMILNRDIEPLFEYGLTQTVCTEDLVFALENMAKKMKRAVKIHIKVDTGMGRLGVLYKDALKFIKKVNKLKFIDIEGIFTHLASADVDEDFTLHQVNLFNQLLSRIKKEKIDIPLAHAANSQGIISYKDSHFNMVRPGLIIYGLSSRKNPNIKLKPVLSLKSKVIYSKRVPKGYGISYGHTYITKKKTTIVTLPIGYGDGYPRNLSNLASALIRGRYFKISGRICMDQIMIDTRNFPVKIGDEAVLIGSQGKNKITAEELAVFSGTIPYEIVCGLGSRVPRVYID